MSIWPIHPRPLPDEILSSWMVRLAHANRYKVHEFYAMYFGRERQIWNRDIDHFAPDWLLNGLSLHTGISTDYLQRLTLRSFEGVVYEKFNETTTTRGLLSLGIYHRTRRDYGQQFCPLCLLSDEQAYLRKIWRIAFITTCKQHQIVLHDRCEHCGKPMMPHRADMTAKTGIPINIGIEYCGSCGKAYTDTNIISASSEAIAHQKLIFDCISNGYISFAGKPLYSFLFLEGIRTLIHGIARINDDKTKLNIKRIEFEKYDIGLRHQRLHGCMNNLSNWPSNFIEFLSRHKQPYSNFVSRNTDGSAVYWIDHTIKSNF